jgi:hypothetical protein
MLAPEVETLMRELGFEPVRVFSNPRQWELFGSGCDDMFIESTPKKCQKREDKIAMGLLIPLTCYCPALPCRPSIERVGYLWCACQGSIRSANIN